LRTVGKSYIADSSGDTNQSASSAAVTDTRGHRALIEDFILAIEQGRAPICDGKEGRKSLALVQAIYHAADRSSAQSIGRD
jgi:predicted dehydrogenase